MTLRYLLSSVIRQLGLWFFSFFGRAGGLVGALPQSKLRRYFETAQLRDLAYEGLYSQASYAPWRTAPEFLAVYDRIRANTLVDIYRCYELWHIAGQLGRLPPGDILEVGVWRGGTGCLLARGCAGLGPMVVHLCDTFRGVVLPGGQDPLYVGGEHSDTSIPVVRDLASALGIADAIRIHEGIFPLETGAAIAECRFRLAHIDVDVYQSARDSFEWVWPRLVPGGIVVFDDYGGFECGGVTRLVNGMIGQDDRLVLYNLNGHALVLKASVPKGE